MKTGKFSGNPRDFLSILLIVRVVATSSNSLKLVIVVSFEGIAIGEVRGGVVRVRLLKLGLLLELHQFL